MKSKRIREAFTRILLEYDYGDDLHKGVRSRAAALAARAKRSGNKDRARKIIDLIANKRGFVSPTDPREPDPYKGTEG